MSLRLIRKNRKGIALEDGRIIWQMMGAEGEGDPADDENDTEEEDSEDDDEDGDKPDKKKSDEDADSLKRRMKAADRRAAAAEQKLRDKELSEKGEKEQLEIKLQQAEAANEELSEKLSKLTRERYFLGSNTVTWHDPEIAMSKLDWDDIMDEDGDVNQSALEKAIKDLAKNKPFLVKKDNVEDDEDNKPPHQQQSSGGTAGSGKKKSKAEIDREQLLRKYPALR